MLAYYADWTPNDLRLLANACKDLSIIQGCDEAAAADGLSPLELTRLDLRRDRAVKRYMRAVRELNLDVTAQESRPKRIAGRYAS